MGSEKTAKPPQFPVPPLHLNVLVGRNEDGIFTAHCLELDIVAGGDTPELAFEELKNLIDVQIRTCIENDDLENLFFPAPKEYWNILARIKAETEGCRSTRHTIDTPRKLTHTGKIELDELCYVYDG